MSRAVASVSSISCCRQPLAPRCRQRHFAPGTNTRQQIGELRPSPQRLEQRIAFEERQAWKAGVHGGAKPAIGLIGLPKPTGRTPGRPDDPRGIPPGQPAVRGSGTRFCVSGPFPDPLPNLTTADPLDTIPTTIEALINGVVVAFDGVVGAPRDGSDVGVWDNPARIIPMYP